mgnify:CR=1 FL=1
MTDTHAIRTLVVDDSEFFAEMTAETLANEHNMDTHACHSVEEAQSFLAEQRVDCIVSDYEMPGANGLDFLSWVRDNYDDVPFILLTGRGDEEVASEAIAGGVADYLLKLEVVEDKQYGRLANRIRSVVDQQWAERKYQRLVENTPDVVAHVAPDGEVLAANESFESLLDADRNALVGQDLPDVFGDGVGTERLETGQRAIEEDETIRTEDVFRGRYFENTFVPLDVRGGKSFQLISRDITSQKERERELRRQNERLETFASVVTHDLRNPLNVASSSLELLEPDIGDREPYTQIDQALSRMDDLINDVLAVARQGEKAHDLTPVSVGAVATDAFASVNEEKATLTIDSSTTVIADESRLQAFFQNLFANAATHAGPDVSIEVGIEEGGFYIADDGPGIDASAREEVFELGYTTDQAGTGMGLAIVKQIADAHGWEIDISESEAGGARFEVTGVDTE